MAEKKDKELSPEEAAALAYERSTASLKDYNPRDLDDEDKAKEERFADTADPDVQHAVPQEPIQVRADGLLPPRGDGKRLTD